MKRYKIVLLVVALLLLSSSWLVSSLTGLGDAEALYYCYGQHPAFSYLDHPPLIGWLIAVATYVGGKTVLAVRGVSMLMTVLSLIFTALLTLEVYGKKAAGWSVLFLASAPVFFVGMIGAAPDGPLAAIWPLFTWQLVLAVKNEPKDPWSRWGRPLLLGALLGLAFLSKYTGLGLMITALVVLGQKKNRGWFRRPGFYGAGLVALLFSSPVVIWNAQHGWAGVLHRLVWSQTDAGFTFRNLGALLGGQLLYVGPLLLVLFFIGGKAIYRSRMDHPNAMVLLYASLPTLLMTYLLVLWSKVAEPHWPAAGYLPLFVAAAGVMPQAGRGIRRLAGCTVGFGVFVWIIAHLVVLTPLLPVVTPADQYEPKYDIANELRGWEEVAATIRAVNPQKKVVVAGFYTLCSQLAFALSRDDDPPVRCKTEQVTDFTLWNGFFSMPENGAIFVTDNRFDHHAEVLFPDADSIASPIIVEIRRGGKWARRFKILDIRGQKRNDNPHE